MGELFGNKFLIFVTFFSKDILFDLLLWTFQIIPSPNVVLEVYWSLTILWYFLNLNTNVVLYWEPWEYWVVWDIKDLRDLRKIHFCNWKRQGIELVLVNIVLSRYFCWNEQNIATTIFYREQTVNNASSTCCLYSHIFIIDIWQWIIYRFSEPSWGYASSYNRFEYKYNLFFNIFLWSIVGMCFILH